MPPLKETLTPGVPEGYKEAPSAIPAPPPVTTSVNLSRDTAPNRPTFQRTPLPPVFDSHHEGLAAWTKKGVPQSRVYSRGLFKGPAVAAGGTGVPPVATPNSVGTVQPDGTSIVVQPTGQIALNPKQLSTRFFNTGTGTLLQAANSVSPSHMVHHVTGSTPIQHIGVPNGMLAGCSLTLIPDSSGSTITGGNIAQGTTLVANKPLTLTYDGGKFYPSY